VAAGDHKETPHILLGHAREELSPHRCVKSLTLLVSRLRTTATAARRTVETWQANTGEGVEMQRRTRFTIKLIALGFAAAAIAAPTAQARLDPGDGVGRTKIVSSNERPRAIQRVTSPQAGFDFGAWVRRHWRNIPE
jgi:hypothetical protein